MREYDGLYVEWFGPFLTIKEAQQFARVRDISGLYAAFGFGTMGLGRPSLQYIGISENISQRFYQHPSLLSINLARIWVGQIDGSDRSDLEFVEWLLIYSLLPKINTRKKTRPRKCIAMINRFWKPRDWDDAPWSAEDRAQKPDYIPDIIYYDQFDKCIHRIDLRKKRVRKTDAAK